MKVLLQVVVNKLSREVELVDRRVLRDSSRAFCFLVVRADPVDPAVSFPVFVEEFDSIVDNQKVSHRAGCELEASSNLREGSTFVFRGRA